VASVETVPDAYLAVALMTLIGIGFPLVSFIMTRFLRPVTDASNPNITRSYFLEGYETDHTLYPRRLSTYECGSEPVGDAMIQFHFQYYWYAIIFLVFDVAFMFMALGGFLSSGAQTDADLDGSIAKKGLLALSAFLSLMILGVWHVFRKRGRIYI